MERRSIRAIFGSIFDQKDASVWVNPVNCVGVMGKGLAKEFAHRFPRIVKPYQHACAQGILRPGKPLLIPVGGLRPFGSKYVCLFPTKDDWRQPSELEWIKKGLEWCAEQEVNKHAWHGYEQPCRSVWAFPMLGAGLGGLGIFEVLKTMCDGFQNFKDEGTIIIPNNQVEEVRKILFEKEMESWGEQGLEAFAAKFSANRTGEGADPR